MILIPGLVVQLLKKSEVPHIKMFPPSRGRVRQAMNYESTSGILFSDDRVQEKFIQVLKECDLKTFRKMIKHKDWDVNLQYRFEPGLEKMSALHYAAKMGMVEIVRDLVMQDRCDTNAKTPFDTATALHFACRVQCSDKAFTIAEILLNHRCRPDCMDHSQCTPLIIASEMGHLHLVSLLLSLGASTSRHAHCEEFPRGVRWSLDHMSLTQRDKDEMCDPFMGNNALHQACREHKVSVVAELLLHGCEKEARNSQGNTALHIACKSESKTVYSDNPTRGPVSGSCKIVRLLVDRNYDLNALNKHTDTPVVAAINGIYEVVQWDLTRDKKQAEILNFLQITKKKKVPTATLR